MTGSSPRLRRCAGTSRGRWSGWQPARAAGDFAAALASARRWLALDPLREEAHRQVMRLHAWADQRNAALHQYRECVRILEQELGVAPLRETTELYEAIKGNRLSPPDLSGLSRPTDLTGFPNPVRSLPLVGRAAELTALIRAYDRHAAGGYFVAVAGEAGIGKTRLAEEFLAQAQAQGAMTVTVRCYEGEADVAYGPVADGLRGALAQSACADRLDALPAHWLVKPPACCLSWARCAPACRPRRRWTRPAGRAASSRGCGRCSAPFARVPRRTCSSSMICSGRMPPRSTCWPTWCAGCGASRS
ncbi:MAG: hypothetical protein QG637_345 [Chloroflexota bacterium]|nr:hypothetical protein [Chloroflexota bacterium]